MIIKATLIGLVIVLIVVIAMSYYTNKEGFDNITAAAAGSNIATPLIPISAIQTVEPISDPAAPIPATGTPTTPGAPAALIPATGTPTIQPIPASGSAPAATPARVDIVPEVTISGVGYDALTLQQRADLLRDIQKTVRNDIMANRAMKPIISGETRQSKDTDATAQGQEYESSCHKDTEYRCPKNPDGSCPPLPDMSQYIKKDAIPCWGCSLDY
jgi:hypothetical protein